MPSEVSSPTVRAAIYARYSSDNQRAASIEDQVEVRRRHAELQGWEIVEVYPDHALSGAGRFRPAFQQMQADAEARRFEVIIVEALDRLSRKVADVTDLHDRLTFPEIRLHAVHAGEITRCTPRCWGSWRRRIRTTWPRRPSEGSWVGRQVETIALVTGHEIHPQACPRPDPGRPREREVRPG